VGLRETVRPGFVAVYQKFVGRCQAEISGRRTVALLSIKLLAFHFQSLRKKRPEALAGALN
jgi:hypothetical protein